MGLSEISHFGTFQRVGGKAGGFISKKFFHPSSFRNQEKLWKAQTQDEREKRKQIELEKRREEERQVEELRKQMYLSGQGKADFLSTAESSKSAKGQSGTEKSEQRLALEEQKRRKALLKQEQRERQARLEKEAAAAESEQAAAGDGEQADTAAPSASSSRRAATEATLAKSRYREDVFTLGHQTVWGSWFSTDEKKWGFKCCKVQKRAEPCPLAADAAAEEKAKEEQRSKKRRKGGGEGARGDASPGDAEAPDEPEGGLRLPHGSAASSSSSATRSGAAAAQPPGVGGGTKREVDMASLMDPRLLEAAERRRQQKRLEEEARKTAKAKPATSGYLANLLQDPSAG